MPLSGRVPAKGRFEAEQHRLDKLCDVHHLHTNYTFDTPGLSTGLTQPLNEVEQERCGLTTQELKGGFSSCVSLIIERLRTYLDCWNWIGITGVVPVSVISEGKG